MSWYDDRDVYVDRRPGLIKLPHEEAYKDPDLLASLSGPVVTYNLKDPEEDVSTCTMTMTPDSGCLEGSGR